MIATRLFPRLSPPRLGLAACSSFRPLSRSMATINNRSLPHEERTASQPRENRLEPVVLSNIREINESVRLIRLQPVNPGHAIQFAPGQWVDTFIPGLRNAGGFTMTSTPYDARPSRGTAPYIELAIQKSRNPPVQWLWRPEDEILGTQLVVRVGGEFQWPPRGLDVRDVERLVFVAGGVGINPLISIFSHLIRTGARPRELHFLYGTKASPDLDRQKILFLPRLMDLVAAADADPHVALRLFLTGTGDEDVIEHGQLPNRTVGRRMTERDLLGALDGFQPSVFGAEHDRKYTVALVCGPPRMTDEVVAFLAKQPGMAPERVLCDRWW